LSLDVPKWKIFGEEKEYEPESILFPSEEMRVKKNDRKKTDANEREGLASVRKGLRTREDKPYISFFVPGQV
jgi:hypothetical protein